MGGGLSKGRMGRFSISINPNSKLDPREQQIEAQATQHLMRDPQGAIANYRQANTKNGTTIYNVTAAKDQLPGYQTPQERTENGAALHEPASALADAAYEQHVQEPSQPGKAGDVVILAGGRAAGKTTTLGDDLGPLYDTEIVWDTHARDEKDITGKIQKAFDNGRNVQAIWVNRNPVDAYDGMVERAQRSGRVLPIDNFVDTHIDGPRNFLSLSEKFKNDPRIAFGVIDNSRGKGNAGPGSVEQLAQHIRSYDPNRPESGDMGSGPAGAEGGANQGIG
jgi:hypothetical protein